MRFNGTKYICKQKDQTWWIWSIGQWQNGYIGAHLVTYLVPWTNFILDMYWYDNVDHNFPNLTISDI